MRPIPRPLGTTEAALRPPFVPRHGVDIVVVEAGNRQGELDAAFDWLALFRTKGTAWRDMAFVVPGKRAWHDRLITALDARRIPHRLLVGHPGAQPDFADDLLHAMSLFTAVAHGRPVVAVVGLGELPWLTQPFDEAMGATRAIVDRTTRALHLSFSRRSRLTDALFVPVVAS